MTPPLGRDLDRDGFASVRGLVALDVVASLRPDLRAVTVANGTASGDLPDAHRWLPALSELLDAPAVTGLVAAACGPRASLRVCKASVTTAEHPPLELHADATVWLEPPFPAGAELVTLLFAFDPIDSDGGCTTLLPGSHRNRSEPTAAQRRTVALVDTQLGAGDALVWRGATWHGRRRRIAPGERVVLIASYGNVHVPMDPRAWTEGPSGDPASRPQRDLEPPEARCYLEALRVDSS